MNRNFLLISLILITSFVIQWFDVKSQNNKCVEISDNMIHYLQTRDGDKAYDLCSKVIKNVMDKEELLDLWPTIEKQFGAFKDTGEVFIKDYKSNKIVFRKLNFELLPLYFKVTIDTNMLISGIFFQPAQKQDAWKRPSYVNYTYIKNQKTEVVTEPYHLSAELTTPRSQGPFPVVILIHGSGPNDMDETTGPNKAFKDIAYGLASREIAVFRYDKRTFSYGAEMKKDELNMKGVIIEDVYSAIKKVKSFREVDTNRIYLLGHSLGGMVVGKIANESSDVKGVIVMASTARGLGELMEIQVRMSMERNRTKGDTAANEEIQRFLDQVIYMNTHEIKNDTPDSLLPMGLTADFWLSIDELKIADNMKKLEKPVLVLHGKGDQQVFQEDFELWQELLGEKKNVQIVEFDKLNHFLMETTSSNPEEDYKKSNNVSKEVIEKIEEWVKQQ